MAGQESDVPELVGKAPTATGEREWSILILIVGNKLSFGDIHLLLNSSTGPGTEASPLYIEVHDTVDSSGQYPLIVWGSYFLKWSFVVYNIDQWNAHQAD